MLTSLNIAYILVAAFTVIAVWSVVLIIALVRKIKSLSYEKARLYDVIDMMDEDNIYLEKENEKLEKELEGKDV